MPVHIICKCSFAADSTNTRDAFMINPTFRFSGPTFDGDGFCQALAQALVGWSSTTGEVHVKSYDLEGTKPIYPNGEGLANPAGVPHVSTVPRELALCLSFYRLNRPTQRGRVYVPQALFGGTLAIRPSGAQQQKALDLKDVLKNAGGVDVEHGVWSRKEKAFHQAEYYWCDNEWDIVRTRGLRPTTRLEAVEEGLREVSLAA